LSSWGYENDCESESESEREREIDGCGLKNYFKEIYMYLVIIEERERGKFCPKQIGA